MGVERGVVLIGRGERDAAQVHAEGAGVEACVHEEASDGMGATA